VNDDHNLFGLQPGHTLSEPEFRSQRGGQYESWKYDEFDAQGQLVARYRKWMESTFFGKVEREGWVKYNLAGTAIASGGSTE
jgi:hypothetical protein